MAQFVKLKSLRIGETFVLPTAELKRLYVDGDVIDNFPPPSEYFIFSSFDRWTHTCHVYSSTSACSSCNFPCDILVIKINL